MFETYIMEVGFPDEDGGCNCWRWLVQVKRKIGTMVIEDIEEEDCEDGQ